MVRILLPKSRVDLDGSLFFLAGPARDAPPWHYAAINYLGDVNVAAPLRGIAPEYARFVRRGQEEFPRQRAWERYYLKLAALGDDGGAIVFWLAGPATHHCEKVYGAMTRVEFGEWAIWRMHDPAARIVVGTDGRFPEVDTMLNDLKEYCPDLPVYSTLEETCRAALKL